MVDRVGAGNPRFAVDQPKNERQHQERLAETRSEDSERKERVTKGSARELERTETRKDERVHKELRVERARETESRKIDAVKLSENAREPVRAREVKEQEEPPQFVEAEGHREAPAVGANRVETTKANRLEEAKAAKQERTETLRDENRAGELAQKVREVILDQQDEARAAQANPINVPHALALLQ